MRVVFDGYCSGTVPLSEVSRFQDDDILLFYDAFDDQQIDRLITQKGHPGALASESFTFFETQNPLPMYCASIWLETEIEKFRNVVLPLDLITDSAANFIINKKQINRHLAMKLAEYYDISVNYTWSGIGEYFDMGLIIDSWQSLSLDVIPQEARDFLLQPVQLSPKWISYRNNRANESSMTNYGGNVWAWNNGIKDVVSRSAISIITESIWTQQAMHFTEKTLYSVLGLTFPLWIGGYRQADSWQDSGFDIFNDVIDHDYQYYPTLIERCWWAFKLNAELLQDPDQSRKLREKHFDRLVANRHKIFNGTLTAHNDSVISAWPSEIQQSIVPVFSTFRHH